jgi:tetratricopeptide (TPR) repeat protein
MRRAASVVVFLLTCPIALAQHHGPVAGPGRGSPCTKKFATAVPRPALQKVDWPVTTESGEAQLFFNQGMTQYYAFNYEEAMRNFRRATDADPLMPMAWWGIALAAGPNINLGMDAGCRKVARDESARASALAERFKDDLTQTEYGLIKALPLRYAGPLTESAAYAVAMRYVWRNTAAGNHQKGPDVANVGALYAESLVELRPWGLFDAAYREALDTPAILDVLKIAKAAEETALGANHYWIHAVEASPAPGDGMGSANLLTELMQTPEHKVELQAPGHLVHMPSHIYLLAGEYEKARKGNADAVLADRAQYEVACQGSYADYTANPECPQLYYGHYVSHNLFFRSVSAAFSGQSREAVSSACETRAHAQRFQANEPGLQRYMTTPFLALVMNRNWKAINEEPKPPADCYMSPFEPNGCHILTAMWHWARGMAAAAENKYEEASKQYSLMAAEMALITPPTPTGWGNNTAAAMLAVAQSTLQARYTWGGNQCKPGKCGEVCPECEAMNCSNSELRCTDAWEQAIEHLKLAVTHEDALVYDEPPQWFPPSREALGGAYLRVAQFGGPTRDEMFKLAEKTFDDELRRHPASGRALFGRMRALEGRGKGFEQAAAAAKTAFCDAWIYADYKMSEDELWPGPPSSHPEVICPRPMPSTPPTACSCNTQPCPPPTPPSP